ncbi:hypothetical protein AM1_B0131 (plasmid) [Acaryochloris marina MBIC11017]|uniref:Uncharacterized protein n=1 Tax=Acaryochloris marina (strain MBIC 11017) TaxID=329726 RepID=A8ZM86_ACAM1|nr:hypothetical protein AM1_B0131 [Acaryochloris marina MBIC11017]
MSGVQGIFRWLELRGECAPTDPLFISLDRVIGSRSYR